MPISISYPGVYVAEMPSGNHEVVVATTSAAAFVGWFPRGAVGRALHISSWTEFQTEFGGLHRSSEAAYAVSQFFTNGGNDAWIVRLITDAELATTAIPVLQSQSLPPATELQAPEGSGSAADAGTAGPSSVSTPDPAEAAAELIVSAASPGAWGNCLRILITSGSNATFDLGVSETAVVNGVATALAHEAYIGLTLTPGAINDAVAVVNGQSSLISLKITGTPVSGASLPILTDGATPSSPLDAWASVDGGLDGALPTLADLDPASVPAARMPDWRTQLRDIAPHGCNILCMPDTINLPTDVAKIVFDAANTFVGEAHAVFLFDLPAEIAGSMAALALLPAWLIANGFTTEARSRSATYVPSLTVADPIGNVSRRAVGPSGTMAGVIARIDTARGVWKAPAGIEAVLIGAEVSIALGNDASAALNSAGINVLREFPIHGPLCWGARTMAGADQIGSQWKYINVRRLFDHIELSLSENLQWVVFEPNNEATWSRIRLELDEFLKLLFASGAFSGGTPAAAYFVRCDATTTSQFDVASGIVRIIVGVAPTKPAEFVIMQIAQITADADQATLAS